MQDQIHKLEEHLAHLQNLCEELSGVAARQEVEITRLTRQVEMLMRREAEREADGSGGVALGDQKPPHW